MTTIYDELINVVKNLLLSADQHPDIEKTIPYTVSLAQDVMSKIIPPTAWGDIAGYQKAFMPLRRTADEIDGADNFGG